MRRQSDHFMEINKLLLFTSTTFLPLTSTDRSKIFFTFLPVKKIGYYMGNKQIIIIILLQCMKIGKSFGIGIHEWRSEPRRGERSHEWIPVSKDFQSSYI